MAELSTQDRIAAKRRQQDPNELQRKAHKAARRGVWTQEDIDYMLADGVADSVLNIHQRIFGNRDVIEAGK